MKKNLLNTETVNILIDRVQQLQASTPPRWGSMTATEMLLHCNMIHQQILSASASTPKKTSPKQYLIRWLVLYILPRFPHNAKAPKTVLTKGTVSNEAFTEQQSFFIEIIRRFPHHKTPIRHYHPYFGNLSTTQWGLSLYKHLDHHLRQFGV